MGHRIFAASREWITRFWGTFSRRRCDHELEEELRLHLDLAAADEARGSLLPSQARRAAVIRLGGMTQSLEALRDQRGLPGLESVWRDVRYALRGLRRSPGFTTVALLTLAVGIGANAAVFSVVNGVLLRPLPYPDSDRLVAVWNRAPGAPGFGEVSDGLRLSLSMYVTYAEENRTFARFGVWSTGTAAVTGLGEPEEVRTLLVTEGTLQALAVPPQLGRWLSREDQQPGSAPTAMLSYGYWQRRFGGASDAVGHVITIDNAPRQIVGVMPRGFRIADIGADVILPIRIDRSRLIRPGFAFFGVARLKPGVTTSQADADVARMLPIWLYGWPGGGTQFYESMRITPALRPLKDDVVGATRPTLLLAMGTIAIVLLIACANVTNLLLIRTEARRRELAVRAALGAGSWRLTRALLIESVLLSVFGGMLGLGVAYAALRGVVASNPTGLPRLDEIALYGTPIAFTFAISLSTGVLVGLAPAVRSAGRHIAAGLHGTSRGASTGREGRRVHNLLVVSEVALAVILLVGSGLMIRSLHALHSVDPGFTKPEQLQVIHITVPATLVVEREQVLRLQNALIEALSSIPGVTSAAAISAMPMEGIPTNWDIITVEDKPTEPGETPPLRPFKYVWPGLFQTIGTRLLVGRDLTWTDIYEGRPVVVISDRLSREVWSTPAAAVGRRIRTGGPNSQWREVVGVVSDVRENGLDAPAPAIVYWPPLLGADVPINVVRSASFVIRSRGAGTDAFMKQVQDAVWSVNGSLPVAAPQTMGDVYERSLSRTTLTLVLVMIAGGMAIALGVIGIYGVLAYTVTQRRREIGIRLALGAQYGELRRRFVCEGLIVTSVGLAIGVAVSTVVTRLMSSLLFQISPLDPLTYLSAALLLMTAAAAASYVPARRVSTVPLVDVLAAE